MPLKDELDVEVNGRDVITGLPKTVRIESEEIRRALNKPLDEMAKAVKDALDATPPDLASDLMYYGILLTGGGALLRGLDVRLRGQRQPNGARQRRQRLCPCARGQRV